MNYFKFVNLNYLYHSNDYISGIYAYKNTAYLWYIGTIQYLLIYYKIYVFTHLMYMSN